MTTWWAVLTIYDFIYKIRGKKQRLYVLTESCRYEEIYMSDGCVKVMILQLIKQDVFTSGKHSYRNNPIS